ncbi:SWI/SNF transcription activation complex subunit [Trachipleistophora hominis]|uniref:SWI/SNF transcription activation complex subunit n=1 Tax=Trachipleistophora hominis TaxID=72359 RepID=L7JT18_TRAHO|nr:SWI/SNF transcription activation complex subunit [Trachipleistophora hominis]
MTLLDLYEKLRVLEMHLDKAVLKKKLLVEESHYKRIKCAKRLRLFINFERFEDSFLLKLDGRVINDLTNTTELRMSDVLKNVCVKLDFEDKEEDSGKKIKSNDGSYVQPEKTVREFYEWRKSKNDMLDCFELNLEAKPEKITVLFEFENTFDRYKLISPVRQLFKKETETKTGLLIDIWKYIRLNRLVIEADDFTVVCDEKLKEIFGCDQFKILDMPELVSPLLLPLDPLILEIPVQKNYTSNFDVPIDVDDFYEFPVMYTNNVIFQLDQKIAGLFDILKRNNAKYEVLKKFAANPNSFINDWIIKQGHLLKESKFDVNNKTFYDPMIQETIFNMLQSYK